MPLAWELLASSVRAGDRLLLDDGTIELRVESADGRTIATTVVVGGRLGERKGISAPGVELPAPGFTDKGAQDLRFGLAHGVDFVALSFVRSAEDLASARRAAAEAGHADVRLVAKIERPEALERLGEILDACDGVMVARGGTPRLLSGLRATVPVIAAVPNASVARSLALTRGVQPVVVATVATPGGDDDAVARGLVGRGLLPPASVVVYVVLEPSLDGPAASRLVIARTPAA